MTSSAVTSGLPRPMSLIPSSRITLLERRDADEDGIAGQNRRRVDAEERLGVERRRPDDVTGVTAQRVEDHPVAHRSVHAIAGDAPDSRKAARAGGRGPVSELGALRKPALLRLPARRARLRR